MKAKKYDLECHDSVLDFTHDCGFTITEIFFPDLDLFVNSRASFIQTPEDREEHDRVPEENFEWIEVSEELELKFKALKDTLVLKDMWEEWAQTELLLKEED